jgi:hypothetical protein
MGKQCTRCLIEKSFNEFNSCSGHKDNLQSLCKTCQALYYKSYYEKRKERIKNKVKKWRESKKEVL